MRSLIFNLLLQMKSFHVSLVFASAAADRLRSSTSLFADSQQSASPRQRPILIVLLFLIASVWMRRRRQLPIVLPSEFIVRSAGRSGSMGQVSINWLHHNNNFALSLRLVRLVPFGPRFFFYRIRFELTYCAALGRREATRLPRTTRATCISIEKHTRKHLLSFRREIAFDRQQVFPFDANDT